MHDRPTAQDHAHRAWQHYRQCRWGKALRGFDRALAQQPDQHAWWMGRGLVLDAMDRLSESATAYERAAAIEPEGAQAWLRLGAARLHLNQPRKAIEALEHAQQIDPNDHTPYCHRIAAYAQVGDLAQAELMFYLGQQQEPDCPHCFDHIAHALAKQGQLETAITCWQRARDIDPTHPRVGINLGRCAAFLRHFGRAQHYYEQHLEQYRDDTDIALELAALFLELGKLEQAEQQLNDTQAVRPDNEVSHHLRGDLALKRGDTPTAQKHYQRALQLSPNRPGVRLGLALAAREQGDTHACIQYLLRELDITGQDAKQVLQLARLLIEQRRHSEAIALLCPALDGLDDIFRGSDAMLAQAHHIRAVAATAMRQHADAIADCRKALRLQPDNPKCWRLLITGYLHENRTPRARASLQRALAFHPSDPALRKLAAQLRWHRLTRAA